MADRPKTDKELWAVLPTHTWVGMKRNLVADLTAAQARVDTARCELDEAELALAQVVTESWLEGASWRAIGVVLGISHQSAWERFGAAARSANEAIAPEPPRS